MSLGLPEILWIFRFIFKRNFSKFIAELIFDPHFEKETPKPLKARLIGNFYMTSPQGAHNLAE